MKNCEPIWNSFEVIIMSNVNADSGELIQVSQNIKNAMYSVIATRDSIAKKYQQLGTGWSDKKYEALGEIVRDCTQSLDSILKALRQGNSFILALVKRLQEYENISLAAGSAAVIAATSQIIQTPQNNSDNEVQANTANWKHISGNHDSISDLRVTNPHFNDGREWKINCQRCVPTYEMRRRGYDVTARPATPDSSHHLSHYPFDAWQNAHVQRCDGSGLNQIQATMRQWGDGSRAQIVVIWRGTNSGHTFIAQQENGQAHFFDPQNGDLDAIRYFNFAVNGTTSFCRIDNVEPSEHILECCEEVNPS